MLPPSKSQMCASFASCARADSHPPCVALCNASERAGLTDPDGEPMVRQLSSEHVEVMFAGGDNIAWQVGSVVQQLVMPASGGSAVGVLPWLRETLSERLTRPNASIAEDEERLRQSLAVKLSVQW